MMLVSIEPVSGDVATISIPRNLERVPLPAGPLADRFGGNFPDLLNAVYTKVASAPGSFAGVSDDPAADATATVVANLLGVRIDDWVLVDMRGFVDIVDALGGVDVDLPRQILLPGNPSGAKHQVPPSIGPGPVRLDGTLALAYARSRSQDSDYKRMGRQRCLVEAAFEQHSTPGLLLAFPDLRDAVAAAMRTTLDPASLERLVRLAPEVRRSTRALLLVPPLVEPKRPDAAAIRALTAAFLALPGSTGPDPFATIPDGPPTAPDRQPSQPAEPTLPDQSGNVALPSSTLPCEL